MSDVLIVYGMECSECADKISEVLCRKSAINYVEVCLENKTVKVDYSEDEMSLMAIENIIDEMGFEVYWNL
ncbi:MAG: Heavy-metal-associated domain [Bacillales bacterium]|jgi:copper chaperone CopZ|nr:Heavy-metal-associated domain [Bacillales bacterium]